MYHEMVSDLVGPHQGQRGAHLDTHFCNESFEEDPRAERLLISSPGSASPTWRNQFPDSDSGDSLFNTQCEAQPFRTVVRRRPTENDRNTYAAGHSLCANGEYSSPRRQRESSFKKRRSSKVSQQRWRRYSRKRMSQRKFLTCELAALGGLLKSVMKMQGRGVTVSKHPKDHWLERRRCTSPLLDSGEGENSEESDIKIVHLNDFIPGYKMARKGYNPWLEEKNTLDTGTEKNENAGTVPGSADHFSESLASDCSGLKPTSAKSKFPERTEDSVSVDVISEEAVWEKKKNERIPVDNGNVEELSPSGALVDVHLKHGQSKCLEPVGDSVRDYGACQAGTKKKKKKKKKKKDDNVEKHFSSIALGDDLLMRDKSNIPEPVGDFVAANVCEKVIEQGKKKKGKQNFGIVEEHFNKS